MRRKMVAMERRPLDEMMMYLRDSLLRQAAPSAAQVFPCMLVPERMCNRE